MFAEERHSRIVELISKGNPVKVVELSKLFGVSESTVRRDLQELDSGGFIQRTHGGAVFAQLGNEPNFYDKEICCLDEKRKIAKVAAQMVEDGDMVLLDSGTTMMELARALCGKKLTVATNSMDIAQVFTEAPQIEVLVLGGMWRKTVRSLVGPLTNLMLKQLFFDKVFLAANAIDVALGVTTHNITEAETKRMMLSAGKTIILVADHSKFGQRGFSRICGLDEVSMVITDNAINSEDLTILRNYAQVIVAD